MARDDEILRRRRENEIPEQISEPQHDPELVAQAMREGVSVASLESGERRAETSPAGVAALLGAPSDDGDHNTVRGGQTELRTPNSELRTGIDPVFTGKVDVMGEYRAALDAARQAGTGGGGGPVTADTVREATDTLRKYQQGKAQLESRIVDNEEYFRLLHNGLERGRPQKGERSNKYRRSTAWMFSAIANKVADFQDNFPAPTVQPRELDDEKAARQLTAIIPAILERNGYRTLYRQKSTDKVKNGTGIETVVWDTELYNGLGDIAIRVVDPLNIFWEPGVTNIQHSANVFTVELQRNDDLIARYPEIPDLQEHLGQGLSVKQYTYNNNVDNSDKSYVINWYYKKRQGERTVLHYCRYVNDAVLYASENDPRYSEWGWYRHGRYPFVFDVMYAEKGTPFGFGEIDIIRDAQDDIDDMANEMTRNVKQSLRRRYFSKMGGGINEAEFADLSRDIVHVEGSIDDNSVKEITTAPISAANITVYQDKINELKETSANRDVTQGGAAGTGGTASGIAQLIESGNKVSRDLIAASYEAFKETCTLIIELVRQFYDVPRSFRILGEDGAYTYQEFDNRQMQSRAVEGDFGMADYQTAEPVFDVTVQAAKNNPWSRQQQNQDAMNLLGMGFFDPENYRKALACLECMDIDNADKIKQVITKNGEAWAAAQAQAAEQIMNQRLNGIPAAGAAAQEQEPQPERHQTRPVKDSGGSVADKARARVQAGTQPR